MGAPFGSSQSPIILRIGGNSAIDIIWHETAYASSRNAESLSIGAGDLQMLQM
jgi:hypothetical protein